MPLSLSALEGYKANFMINRSQISLLSGAIYLLTLPLATIVTASEAPSTCISSESTHIAEQYLINHTQKVSRDFYSVRLKESNTRLEICGFIGGEHTNLYRILGFSNEHFRITAESFNGIAHILVSSDNAHIKESDDTYDAVIGQSVSAWVEVSVSADFESFTSGYRILIERIK